MTSYEICYLRLAVLDLQNLARNLFSFVTVVCLANIWNGKPELFPQITSSDFQDWIFGTIPPPPLQIKGGWSNFPTKKIGGSEATKKSKEMVPSPPKNFIKHATPILNKLKKSFFCSFVTWLWSYNKSYDIGKFRRFWPSWIICLMGPET